MNKTIYLLASLLFVFSPTLNGHTQFEESEMGGGDIGDWDDLIVIDDDLVVEVKDLFKNYQAFMRND